MSLIKHVNSINDYEALRFIVNLRPNEQDSFEDDIASLLEHKDEFAIFDPMVINKLHNDFVNYQPAIDYMASRSFTMETLEHFNVGWSAAKGLVTVPCYSHTNIPVGVIGRSIEGKRFKNSIGLPSSKVFFNFNRAIRTSSTAVIVESAFDAMRVHQSGWQNVIATLGGHLSPYKKDLLNRYFDRIIIMTDNDKPHYNTGRCNPCDGICKGHNPGRELGEELAQSFKRDILWAMWDDDVIYPHGAKDAGDMTDSEINTVLALAQSDFDYRLRKTIK